MCLAEGPLPPFFGKSWKVAPSERLGRGLSTCSRTSLLCSAFCLFLSLALVHLLKLKSGRDWTEVPIMGCSGLDAAKALLLDLSFGSEPIPHRNPVSLLPGQHSPGPKDPQVTRKRRAGAQATPVFKYCSYAKWPQIQGASLCSATSRGYQVLSPLPGRGKVSGHLAGFQPTLILAATS